MQIYICNIRVYRQQISFFYYLNKSGNIFPILETEFILMRYYTPFTKIMRAIDPPTMQQIFDEFERRNIKTSTVKSHIRSGYISIKHWDIIFEFTDATVKDMYDSYVMTNTNEAEG